MNVNITFESTVYDQTMQKLLQAKADLTGKTINEFLEHWIDTWAQGQARGYYIDKVNNMTLAQLWQALGPIE
jgi:hypothetical protein